MHPRPWPTLTLPVSEYGGARCSHPIVARSREHHFSHSNASRGENLHARTQGGMTGRLSRPSVTADAASAYRFTPLMRAITSNDNPAVAGMLLGAANPMEPTSNGTSPLMVAIHFNNQLAIRLLIQANAYVNQGTHQGVTSLMVAAIHSNRQALRLLIAAGAEIDQATSSGQTAAMIASQFGNEDSLIMLAKAGADLDRQDHDGRSALTYAALHGQKKILTLLWMLHADFDREAKYGNLIQYLDARGQPGMAEFVRRIITLPGRPSAVTSSEPEGDALAHLTAPESNLDIDTCMPRPATMTAFSATGPMQIRESSSKRAREPVAATPVLAGDEDIAQLQDLLPLSKYARS
jgi:ankyrin repeat protein